MYPHMIYYSHNQTTNKFQERSKKNERYEQSFRKIEKV